MFLKLHGFLQGFGYFAAAWSKGNHDLRGVWGCVCVFSFFSFFGMAYAHWNADTEGQNYVNSCNN